MEGKENVKTYVKKITPGRSFTKAEPCKKNKQIKKKYRKGKKNRYCWKKNADEIFYIIKKKVRKLMDPKLLINS